VRAGGDLEIAGASLAQRRITRRLFACLMRPRGVLMVIRAELRLRDCDRIMRLTARRHCAPLLACCLSDITLKPGPR